MAIDIPSGLGDDIPVDQEHVQAELTITMGHEKLAMYHPRTREACKEIICINPSFPPFLLQQKQYALLATQEDISIRKLSRDSYKNQRGHVAIFGGSVQYSGAAKLSAKACFAARAGLVTHFCDEEVYAVAAAKSPSVMVRIYQDDLALDRYQALLAGPGWGLGREAILARLFASKVPLVLDADGIRAYAAMLCTCERLEHGPLILTPHIGELATLVKSLWPEDAERIGKFDSPLQFFTCIEKLSETLQATLVVKSSLTYVVSPNEKTIVIQSRNPSLGVAGSGDVLAGIIAALLCQNPVDLHHVAYTGAFLHMQAGKRAKETYGYYDSEALVSVVGTTVLEAER
ncbi:MAG: NAD(P)H-hydrate dehydratase [Spirochaetia bacterium]|nr:NAD(P)H-hydrate dehydratase [Spirochaetia bacterium]